MALTNIEYGALASSTVMNNNFEYLDNRISSLSEVVTSGNASIYSNIASISSTITANNLILRPIGQPILRLSNLINDDEIRLEGAEVSRTTYAALFEIYGITYGSGDGVSTFKLPDFRNKVMWGSDSFGYIEAGLPDHSHSYTAASRYGKDPSGGNYAWWCRGDSGGGYATGTFTNASTSNSIYGNSATVQPPSIKIRVVTRYK